MILSGDIGGTKAELALYERTNGLLKELHSARLLTDGHDSLEEMLDTFLAAHPGQIASAAFGIAGPVLHNQVVGTNLPWTVAADTLARRLNVPRVEILNDLEATAHGLEVLSADDLVTLQDGRRDPEGALAVIAAGTGLGEAYATRNSHGLSAHASEGGHSDYAPNNEDEADLWLYLHARFGGHVSWERILSGPGLSNIYEFLRDTGRETEPAWLAEARTNGDPHAAITAADGRAPIATRTLDLFIDAYGAEAGNLALKFMATGGVYVAGGIAPKLRERMTDGRFLRAFRSKGRLSQLTADVPVQLVLNERTALLGAAMLASRRAGS